MRVASRTRKGKTDDTIWWRVTVWGEQFDKMISFLKKGSAVMVYGEVHKPELFNDREGKPQISLEITAVHLEFSPFGKPGGSPAGEGQTAQAAPFNAPQSYGAPQPVGATQGKGETFDDEVPF